MHTYDADAPLHHKVDRTPSSAESLLYALSQTVLSGKPPFSCLLSAPYL